MGAMLPQRVRRVRLGTRDTGKLRIRYAVPLPLSPARSELGSGPLWTSAAVREPLLERSHQRPFIWSSVWCASMERARQRTPASAGRQFVLVP